MDVLGTFNINIEAKNLYHGSTKDQWPYTNQDQDNKPQSVTSRVLWSPIWGLKGHGYYRVSILKMGMSEVKVSVEVISTTGKLYWAL